MLKSNISNKALFSDTLIYGIARITSSILSVFLIPVYTRYFTVAEYGIIENLNILNILIISIFSLGLSDSIVRFYSVADSEIEKKIILSSVLTSTVLSGIISLLLGLIYAPWFGEIFIQKPFVENLFLVNLILLLTFLIMPFNILLTVLNVKFKKKEYILVTVGNVLLSLVLSLVFVIVLDFGIIGVFLASLISHFIFVVYLFYLLRNEIAIKWISFTKAKELIFFCLAIVPSSITLLIMRSSDRYFIAWLLPDSLNKIGLYATAEKVMTPILLCGAAFSIAWTPFAMKVSMQQNAKEVYIRTFKYYISIMSVLLIILSASALLILKILTTPTFYPSYIYSPVIGLYLVINALYFIVGIGIILSKKVKIYLPISITSAVINITLNYILIPPFGIYGAAWATVVTFLLFCVLTYIYAEKYYYIGYPFISGLLLLTVSTFIAFIIMDHLVIGLILLAFYVYLLFALKYLEYDKIKNMIIQLLLPRKL